MIVYAFRKGVCPGPFCESIIRSRPRTFAEIRHRAVENIASEGEVCEKCASVAPSRPRAQTRAQPVRVNETTTGRKKPEGRRPYENRKPQPRGPAGGDRPVRERTRPARYSFVVDLKDLIAVPNIAERLRRPARSTPLLEVFPAGDTPPPSGRNTRGGSIQSKRESRVSHGSRISCSRGEISEMWYPTTTTSCHLSRHSQKKGAQSACRPRKLGRRHVLVDI